VGCDAAPVTTSEPSRALPDTFLFPTIEKLAALTWVLPLVNTAEADAEPTTTRPRPWSMLRLAFPAR
jgi:hypothetical protein